MTTLAPDLTEADLVAAGLGPSAGGIEFEAAESADLKAGDVILNYGDSNGKLVDGGNQNRIIATMSKTTTDNRMVAIYDITGRRIEMIVTWAVERLKKRYPQNHPNPAWRGQPVFTTKPRCEAPVPTVPCPLVAEGRCKKMLMSDIDAKRHFKSKHPADFSAREERSRESLLERQVLAQERSAALMERLLSQGVRVPDVMADDSPVDEADEGPEMPDESWSRQSLVKWLKDSGNRVPDDWVGMSKDEVWAYVKALALGEVA